MSPNLSPPFPYMLLSFSHSRGLYCPFLVILSDFYTTWLQFKFVPLSPSLSHPFSICYSLSLSLCPSPVSLLSHYFFRFLFCVGCNLNFFPLSVPQSLHYPFSICYSLPLFLTVSMSLSLSPSLIVSMSLSLSLCVIEVDEKGQASGCREPRWLPVALNCFHSVLLLRGAARCTEKAFRPLPSPPYFNSSAHLPRPLCISPYTDSRGGCSTEKKTGNFCVYGLLQRAIHFHSLSLSLSFSPPSLSALLEMQGIAWKC